MLNQNFIAKEFSFLVRRGDYHTYFKPEQAENISPKDKKEKTLKYIENHLFSDCPPRFVLKQTKIKNSTIYTLDSIKKDKSNIIDRAADDFVLRKINKNLRRIYNIKQSDRTKIIQVIKSILSTHETVYIYKTDITHFYESINKESLLNDINRSSVLSSDTKYFIGRFFDTPLLKANKGLPRGINISATLSEYYMRAFDRNIKKLEGVFYYARYVDDIIIFSTKEVDINTVKQISSSLPKGLKLNTQKTQILTFKTGGTLCFLGYSFTKTSKDDINISISPKKIKKIQKRITCAFLAFVKDRNFKLLKDRILFLSANYPMKTEKQSLNPYEKPGTLHGGIAYNYHLINDPSCLKALDCFLYKIIFTRSFIKINQHLSDTQKEQLHRLSFYASFMRRITRKFTLERISTITTCWE